MKDYIIENGKTKIIIRFNGDIAHLEYYFNDQLVDAMLFPHTNAIIDFITNQTKYRENTVRRYIYKNKKDEFVKNGLITFENNSMNVLDIDGLIKALNS